MFPFAVFGGGLHSLKFVECCQRLIDVLMGFGFIAFLRILYSLRYPGSATNTNCAMRTLRWMLLKAEEWKMIGHAPKNQNDEAAWATSSA